MNPRKEKKARLAVTVADEQDEATNAASSSRRSRSPNRSGQVEPEGNAAMFKQLFATLEAEHQKMHLLEQRRLKLTEEMRSLRESLQQENLRLRSKSQEPPASFTAANFPGDNRQEVASAAKKSTFKQTLRWLGFP